MFPMLQGRSNDGTLPEVETPAAPAPAAAPDDELEAQPQHATLPPKASDGGRFPVDRRVLAQWEGRAWYPGVVVGFDAAQATYHIKYDDGDYWCDVPAAMVRAGVMCLPYQLMPSYSERAEAAIKAALSTNTNVAGGTGQFRKHLDAAERFDGNLSEVLETCRRVYQGSRPRPSKQVLRDVLNGVEAKKGRTVVVAGARVGTKRAKSSGGRRRVKRRLV